MLDASNTESLMAALESSRRSNSRPISGDTLGGVGGGRKDSAAGIEADDFAVAPLGSREGQKMPQGQGSGSGSLPPPQGMYTSSFAAAGWTNRGVHEDYTAESGKGTG